MSLSIRTARAVALAATLATACAACSSPAGQPTASRTAGLEPGTLRLGDVRLVSYSNCDDMLTGLREKTARSVGPWGLGGPVTYRAEANDAVAKLDQGPSASSGATEHSGTNVHEAGVDEPDMVKTDGKRVITVSGGVLRVVDAATRKVTGSLRLVGEDQRYVPADLLLHGDRALVLISGGGGFAAADTVKRSAMPSSRYLLVDLAGTPKLAGSITPVGAHVDARMVGSKVRIVVRDQPDIAFPDLGRDGGLSDAERTRRNREAVEKAPIDAWLPKYEVTDAAGARRTVSVPCEQISHPQDYTGTSMLSVHSLDLAAGDQTLAGDDPIAVAADGDTVYGTGESLYVTSNPRWWFPIPDVPLPEPSGRPSTAPSETAPTGTPSGDPAMPSLLPEPVAPRQEPTPVEPVPAKVGPTPTAEAKPAVPPELTEIHRFDISAAGPPRYVASGLVPGRLLNQYSLSEHDGHLRVATTSNSTDGRDSESGVYVLRAGDLTETGRVTGLGKDERIYSVRFIGPMGYVVTFRQVDPLYTLDLRDPAAPRTTGELKITGYSAYLHPAGEGRLIGVGQEASEEGRTQGTQVSLFDVSDPAAPRRLSQMFQKDSGSEAEWNPHAFLYWPQTGQAVLPVNSYTENVSRSRALVLSIGADKISKQGEVAHPRADGGFAPVDHGLQRALVINATLWTLSDGGLQVNDLKTLADQAWIPFS
jgi:hypothetical protein